MRSGVSSDDFIIWNIWYNIKYLILKENIFIQKITNYTIKRIWFYKIKRVKPL